MFFRGAEVTDDGQFLVVSVDRGCDPTNLLYFYDFEANQGEIHEKLPLTPIISEFEAKFEFIANDGPIFTLLTNENSPMFKLIQIDIRNPKKENWKILVPENPNAKLDWASVVAGNKLVLCYMEDVKV